MNLTVPASTVERVVNALLSRGRIVRGYLGLAMQPVQLPETLRSPLALQQERGLIVVSVEADGPAERAGAIVGDILVTLAGKPVTDTEGVQSLLDPDQVGATVPAQIIRGGSLTELSLTVGERPRRGE